MQVSCVDFLRTICVEKLHRSFFIFVFFSVLCHCVSELLAAPKRYPAYAGKEVELECDWGDLSGTLTSVTWRRADEDILIFKNGVVTPNSPDHKFQFTDVQDDDFSLELMDVTTEDEGIYIYEVHTNEKSKTYSVALQVCK